MNYNNIYNKLVERAKSRGLDKSTVEGYHEIHHIVPRSLGGSDEESNLVMLTGREHYIGHMLLWKANPENSSIAFAARMMSNRFTSVRNSKTYEKLRAECTKKHSEKMRGKKVKDLLGNRYNKLVVTEQDEFYITRKGSRASKWMCTCDCGNMISVVGNSLTTGNTKSCGCLTLELGKAAIGEKNPFFGKKHTEETKQKFKNRKILRGPDNPMFGRKWTEEQKAAARARESIPWSDERKSNYKPKVGEDHWNFGKKVPKSVIDKAIKTKREKYPDQRPWENIATQTDESLMKWAMCDYYYDLWKESGEIGLKRFTKFYNETHNDNVSLAFFTNPRIKFIEGWIPQEDIKWVEFSDKYLKGTWSNG